MKLKNGWLEQLVAAVAELCANRLPGRVAARVYRAKRLLGEAWVPVQEAQENIMREHGAVDKGGGRWELPITEPGHPDAVRELQALAADEVTLLLEPIPWEEIVGGAFPVFVSGDHYGALLEAGVISDAEPAKETDVTPIRATG